MIWLLNNRFYSYVSKDDFLTYYNLVINNVQLLHAGKYLCLGYDEEYHRFQDVGELVVKGK